MKLEDILEAAEQDTKAVLAAYKEAHKLKVYETILSLGFRDVSGPIQVSRGVFQFEAIEPNKITGRMFQSKEHRWYTVFPTGTVRYAGDGRHAALQRTPNLTADDHLENYQRLLSRVIEVEAAKAKGVNSPPPVTYKDNESTIIKSNSTEAAYVVHDEMIAKLPPGPDSVKTYTLMNLPNLTSLKGGPKHLLLSHAILSKLPKLKTLEGFPSFRHELYVSVTYCPELVTLEGLDCTTLELSFCKSLRFSGFKTKHCKSLKKLILHENVQVKSHALGFALLDEPFEFVFKNRTWKPGQSAVGLPEWVELLHEAYKHPKEDRLIEFQHKLIEAGLHELAQL